MRDPVPDSCLPCRIHEWISVGRASIDDEQNCLSTGSDGATNREPSRVHVTCRLLLIGRAGVTRMLTWSPDRWLSLKTSRCSFGSAMAMAAMGYFSSRCIFSPQNITTAPHQDYSDARLPNRTMGVRVFFYRVFSTRIASTGVAWRRNCFHWGFYRSITRYFDINRPLRKVRVTRWGGVNFDGFFCKRHTTFSQEWCDVLMGLSRNFHMIIWVFLYQFALRWRSTWTTWAARLFRTHRLVLYYQIQWPCEEPISWIITSSGGRF